MFLCSLIEELCTKEENDKTGFNFIFGHECISNTIVTTTDFNIMTQTKFRPFFFCALKISKALRVDFPKLFSKVVLKLLFDYRIKID